jgi:hypothetical protein
LGGAYGTGVGAFGHAFIVLAGLWWKSDGWW